MATVLSRNVKLLSPSLQLSCDMTGYVSFIILMQLSPEAFYLQCIQAVKLTPFFHLPLTLRKREYISTLSHRYHVVEFNKLRIYKSRQSQNLPGSTKLYHFRLNLDI